MKLFLLRLGGPLVAVALLLSLVACASISVEPGMEAPIPKMPEKIYVANFSTAHSQFNVDREKVELTAFKKDLQHILQVAQVADLNDRLIEAEPAPAHPWDHVQNAWLIRGEFVLVNQGSRFLRTTIGFGAGGTKLETKVVVYDLSRQDRQPILTFSTTGGSNAEPGAVTSFATDPLDLAVQIALSGVSGFSHGLTEDTKRTAREITAQLSDVMYRHHLITKENWMKPKRLGQITTP